MKELRFLQAMNDIDEEYLLEAEQACARRPRLLPRIAAVAAIVALLTVGVYAAVTKIDIQYEPDNITMVYDGVSYSPEHIRFDLDAVAIEDAVMEEATQLLLDYRAWCMENRIFHFTMNQRFFTADWRYVPDPNDPTEPRPQPLSLSTPEEAEDYLGIDLHLPQLVRDAVIDDRGLRTTILTASLGADPDEAEQNLKAGDDISPQLMSLEFGSSDPAEDIIVMNTHIYLALTEEGAAVPLTLTFQSAQELRDPCTEEMVVGDQTYTIRYHEPTGQYSGEIDIFYVRDGIGYLITVNAAEGIQADGLRDILLPLLESMT